MKRKTLITLAAALLPLAGFAEEKALWEVQARLDGGKNPRLNGWIKELFAKDGSTAMIGDKAVFRIAGFDNEATPEEDWVAEVHDLADPAALMKETEAEAKPDGQGLRDRGTGIEHAEIAAEPQFLRIKFRRGHCHRPERGPREQGTRRDCQIASRGLQGGIGR